MGRLIAVVLFIALLVPGVLLSRAWWLASGRRVVAGGAVELTEPTAEGMATLHRQAQHGRRIRGLGWLLGLAGIVGGVVMFAEASVFLWIPALVLGLLAGVLLAEVTRPRPRWGLADPARRPRQGDQISGWLVWTMRAVVVAEATAALLFRGAGELQESIAWTALVMTLTGWLLAELALARALLRPLPAAGADMPVDEALRTWTAHLVTAAASILALLPFGALLLKAGIERGGRISDGLDLVPVALVAGGFSALAAGLALAGFLFTWLRPVQLSARALAG